MVTLHLLRPALLLAFAMARPAHASEEEPVDFAREVLPILSDKCFVCHGPTAGERQLRLDSFAGATAERRGGRAVDPAAPEDSLILQRIHSADRPMPPADAIRKLDGSERELLSRWVRQGGEYARHWAFVPPAPSPTEGDDPRAVLDGFIERGLSERGLAFSPPADPFTLARRVALVLTGLPPEPEVLERYLAGPYREPDGLTPSINASGPTDEVYEALVTELFASPRYGEHQARYWLDAVRYGDTHGLHLDNRRGIYPYRDWVVRALNQNLPLDDFITWQLAGDLLPDSTLEQQVATGFVRMNPSTAEGGAIPAEFQAKNNFDRVENLGTVLLGMTFTCARCHDHKYDPISQTEYYRLLAFFNSTAEPSMDGNKYEYGPVVKAPEDQPAWEEWTALERESSEQLRRAAEELGARAELAEEAKSFTALTAAAQRARLADPAGPLAGFETHSWAVEHQARRTAAAAEYTTTLVARELPKPRETRRLHRGEYHLPEGDPLEPDVPRAIGQLPDGAPADRLGLARWLTAPEQPLAARVLVNRLWQRVFGHGLVRSPEDFGLQGQQPTHPELLDWLAVHLQESGWDLQHMLRLMVGSRTFRQSSAWREDADDPENRLWARGPAHRLDAEVLRDVALWASELLDPHMGGEGVKPYQPAGMWKALAHPGSNTKQYVPDTGERLYRRSLYLYWKRTSPHPMMTLFDAPDRESSCVRRSRTSTALQSLGMFNEIQRVEMARKLAERLMRERVDDGARLNRLFELLTCRGPTEKERQACAALVQAARERYAAANEDALALLSTGEAARDDSLDPAAVAAWTQVVLTLLASEACTHLY